jgi:hypothetical protein
MSEDLEFFSTERELLGDIIYQDHARSRRRRKLGQLIHKTMMRVFYSKQTQ